MEQASRFVQFVTEQRAAQRPVAVHCEAGLGRTGTMLAVYLIFQVRVQKRRSAVFEGWRAARLRPCDRYSFCKSLPVVERHMRTLTIGDIHGCNAA